MTDTTTAATTTGTTGGSRSDWRAMYLVAFMRGATFLGDIAAATAVELSLQSRGFGGFTVAAVLLAATLPPIVLGPISGRIVDRYHKPTVLVATSLVQVVASGLMFTTTDRYLWTAIIFVMSAGIAFTHPILGSMPGALIARDQQPKAASLSQVSAMAGMLCAPVIGAFASAQIGVDGAFAVNTVSFALVLLGALRLGRALAARTVAKPAGTADATQPEESGFRVWSDRALRAVLVSNGALMIGASTINVYVVFLVRDSLGASETMYGIVGSAWMLGLIPGALAVSKLPITPERLLIGSFALVGIGILGAGLAPSVWLVLPFYFLGGLGNGAGATATHVLLNTYVPEGFRGRAFAALGMVSNSGPTLGMLIGGGVLSFATPREGYFLAGALVLSVLVAVAPMTLRIGTTTDRSAVHAS